MSDSPNYRFHRKPRFSANHLADYLCTIDAAQRERVIRAAKFPKKPPTIAYQAVVPVFRDFLRNGKGDLSYLDGPLDRLSTRAERETGDAKNETLRCIKALKAFISAYAKGRFANIQFGPTHSDVAFKVSEVSINCRLDPPIFEFAKDGSRRSGGCLIFLASTPQARKNIAERAKFAAATVHWALEHTAANFDPVARLCMVFDVFGESVIKAPPAYDRLRGKMEASCREVADVWDRIAPPPQYDGPAWH